MRNCLILALIMQCGAAYAAETAIKVPMNIVDEKGGAVAIGEVTITESAYGLVFTPALSGLPAGVHGFHIHENASCAPGVKDGKAIAALGAGGHWDPAKSGHHAGPYGDGHKGDLPAVQVGSDGKSTYPILAPRLHSLDELRGHALMIHAGGDNSADLPAPLGGGGARIACGVIN